MNTRDIKKWLSFGSGIGVEIRGSDLVVTVVRVRPKEIRVMAATTIKRFRERPANEWGGEYNKFLRDSGVGHLTATVLLPREEIIVRQLTLPGVAGKDLAAAIRYQVDSLHPYPEGEVSYGWARVPDSQAVLIGLARIEIIEHYTLLFAEAGVRTASLTFSAAVAYSAVRLLATPPSEGFLVLEEVGNDVEAYGESPSRPVFSASFDLPVERIVSLSAAELRLETELEPIRLADLLAKPRSVPDEWNLDQFLLSYAAALVGACPWLALSANLLAREHRSKSSQAVYAPTVALAALLLIALVTLGAVGSAKERSYSAALDREIARFSTDAGRVAELDAEMEAVRQQRDLLREFRLRTRDDLDALRELTILLAPPAWLREIQSTREQLRISGEAPEAAQLLEIIDSSRLFRNSEYTSPISDTGDMQSFAIQISRVRDGSGEQQ